MYATISFSITLLGIFSIFELSKGNQKFSLLKYYILARLIIITAGLTGQALTTTAAGTLTWTNVSTSGVHSIGEAYGGGIVFYVYDNGKHGLIAATSDQILNTRWYGGSYTNTRARADGVGAGLKNT